MARGGDPCAISPELFRNEVSGHQTRQPAVISVFFDNAMSRTTKDVGIFAMKCDPVGRELDVLESELLSVKEHIQRDNLLLA
jgi:hypothetical protein